MTCREKLAMEHPEDVDDYFDGGCFGCPSSYKYMNDPEWCKHSDLTRCGECWDREIPGEKSEAAKTGEALVQIKDIVQEHGGITVYVEPTIKDSGDRTEFATGAVRDMREGKGRCDLMPLEVVSRCINYDKGDCVFDFIRMFQITNDTRYLYEILDVFATKAFNANRYTMFLEVAKHFEEGAKKYGESNWQLGIPVHCYIDSAVRHYLKWLRGDKDEPHDRAFVWNLMCCIWEVDYHEKES